LTADIIKFLHKAQVLRGCDWINKDMGKVNDWILDYGANGNNKKRALVNSLLAFPRHGLECLHAKLEMKTVKSHPSRRR
jgi:hypothetical protein